MKQSDHMSKDVRMLRGGQVTIPVEFRRRLGINEETMLRMSVADGELRVSPLRLVEQDGYDWLHALYDAYAPVRANILAQGISEEEINADIDAAIAEVRAEHLAPSR